MTHCLWSTLLGLLSVLSMATSRSVRQLPSGYPPVLPTGYYGQPPYAYPPYGYGYQAPPPVYQPYYDNVFGVFKSYPGGGIPVRFDYSNRCSRNYIGIKPHPDQQQYYYVCKPDCVIFSKCRSLESFDASSGRCVQRVSQHRPDHRPPQCQKEGRFPHPHDCQVYYRCDKNRTQPWLFACPSGTIFSPVERKCLPGDQCPSTEISDSGSYIPQNCELKFPECAEEGTFRSPTDCALYYTCRLQESGTYLQTRFKCPGSNSFDLEGKLCRPRSEVDCFDYVPGPVQVPYAPQPYYPPYPAAPPLYEEDDYDTEAKEQQPALKSYPSYKYSTHHRAKEMAAENLEVQQEGVPRNLKLSENVPDLPTMSASAASNREPSKDTTKYQYTDTNPAKNDVTEAPELKSPLKGLHLSQHIVIIESKTTKPPVVSTCPTIPPPSTTLKPSTTSTVTKTTEVISSREPHRTTSAKITTKRHTTVTKKTSTATEKPKTTVVTRTTQKRSTATHNTSPVRTTTIGSTTITPKTSTVAARTEKTTISSPKPSTKKSTENTTTTSVKTSAITSSTQKAISTTSKPTTTTQKITTPTPKPTTLKTSTQKPITSTQKESTVTITTKKATESSPLPTLSTEKATTTPKLSTTTTATTTTVAATTRLTTTTISKSSTKTTSSQKPDSTTPKPTTTTNPKTTTVIISTQNPTTSTPKTSTVIITTPKPISSTQKPTSATFQPTSVTATSKSIGTTKVATTTTPQNSTASTAVTTATRSPCADSNSTSDKNTNPACTQELEQVNLLELQSPQKQVTLTDTQPNTSFSGRRNTLDGQEAPDYMDDAPSSAEAQSGQATTARAQTMSTLAAAHILQKLFHIISTTPPSKEHAPTQRPSSQHSSSQSPRGVTIAQMARHNLATSKPFIAHSLRLSIQQLASTQKGSVQPTRKEPEDSEYYDSETSEQYADEENEVLDKTQPRAMSSTTVAALIPAAPSTTTKPESHITTSLPRQTRAASSTTAQPIESPTGELEYGDSSEGSDYVNDANDIPSGVVTSLEARKNFLISLLKQRLTHTELQKPLPAATTSTTPGAPQTSSSSAGPASTTIKSTLALTSSTARPGLTASKHSGPQAPSRQKSLTPLSEEYYDEDDDYMEDEPAGSSEAKKKETGAVLVDDRPPAATAKRHVAQPVEQAMFNRLASRSRESEVEMNAASDELLKRLGRKKTQIPTGSTPNRASAVAKALRRRLAAEVGHPSGLTVPHTSSDPKATQAVMQTTTRTESSSQTTPSTSTETPATQASQKARTRESGEQKPESITQSTLEMVTQTTPESAPPATAVPVAVRQEVLSVNSRPWLLAARNQTVHLTPMSSISISSDARTPSNPVSHANRSFNPLVSRPGDHSTEKVPQLIVKVYEPIDLKIVFCPQSCDQDHDHKYDPADNYKKSNCTGGCDEEEERVHKHVDIQWKPLELTDIAGFRNAV